MPSTCFHPFPSVFSSRHHCALTDRMFCSYGVQYDTVAGGRGAVGSRAARRRARKRHAQLCVFVSEQSSGAIGFSCYTFLFF